MKTDYIIPAHPSDAQRIHLASAFERMQQPRPVVSDTFMFFLFVAWLAAVFAAGIIFAIAF